MLTLPIIDTSQVASARRAASELARTLGFDATALGQVTLVATELASNLVKHAVNGQIVMRTIAREDAAGVEFLALDKGPGMANVAECLRDGFSTAGSPGTGLGAIMRTSAVFDIYSIPGKGTALLAQLYARPQKSRKIASAAGLQDVEPSVRASALSAALGVVCLPKPGEEACGDDWAVASRPGRGVFLVADGLGHGPDAARAAQEAVRIFHKHAEHSPAEILTAMHAALHATRGAAAAITEIDRTKQMVRFCGVGNIAGRILTLTATRSMVSHNGIVGHAAQKIQEFIYPWSADALLVMCSDGLTSSWSLETYPGLLLRSPSLIASILYRDFSRGRDDVTVLVARQD